MPFMNILPSLASVSRIINFIIVDFPAALLPTRNTNSPLSILKDTFLSAGKPFSYVFETLSNSINTHNSSKFHSVGTQVLVYHHCNFENYCVVKDSEVKTRNFLDFVKSVNQRVSVNIELA